MPVPGGTLTHSGGVWTDFVQGALDLETSEYLREEPIFRQFADKHPTRQAHPGDVVTLKITGELGLATTPLTETSDVDAVAPPANRDVTVTLAEYGNAMVDTHFLRQTDFTQKTAARIGKEIGLNAVRSIDKVYQNVLDGASNVFYMNNSGAAVLVDPAASTGPIKANTTATAVTLLRRRNAEPWFNSEHVCVLHPDVAFDLKTETGNGSWRNPHEYVDPGRIYKFEIGLFHNTRFMENTKCTVAAGTPDKYTTYFIGREALAEVVSDDVRTVVADPIDALKRFYRIGWYALLGVSRFRENAIQLLKTSSTIETGLFAGTAPAYDGKA